VILNSEQRELSTRNCLGIFSKEIRKIDEFQLKSFVTYVALFSNFDSLHLWLFLQKQQNICAVLEEGVIFSLSLYKQ